jgi:curved DNA-binding protein CbpA
LADNGVRTLYEVLGVDLKASTAEIAARYRGLVFKNHPDRNPNDPGAAARLAEILLAWEVLSDPRRRASYNLDISGGRKLENFLTSREAWRFLADYFPAPPKAEMPGSTNVEAVDAPTIRWICSRGRGGRGARGGPAGDQWTVEVPSAVAGRLRD